MRISRPPVRRPPVNHLGDIDKTRVNHLLLVQNGAGGRAVQGTRGLEHEVGPLADEGGGRQSAVVAARREANVLALNPAAGGEALVALCKEAGPVDDGADEHAGKDEVEGVGKGPFVFEVVDLEAEVGGDTVKELSWDDWD